MIRVNRNFSMGVGTGFIIAALAGLVVSPFLSGPSSSVDLQTLAAQQGDVVLSKSSLAKKLADARQQGMAEARKEERATAAVSVYIAPGMNLSDIGALLAGAGVLDDEKAFEAAAQDSNLSQSIIAGLYRLEPHSDPKHVLATLTTPARSGP
jgi:hypothetical protein